MADKLFAILDAFGGERTELTAAQLSRLTGVAPSTMSRLLRCLVNWGGLSRSDSGGYRVGIKLWEIATRFRVGSDLRTAALPFMRDLALASEGDVGLCVLEGNDGVIVDKLSSPSMRRSIGCVGGRLPLHASALGKVLLAFSPAALREEYLDKPLTRFTEKTLTSSEALRREIAHVRAQRYAVCDGEMVPGQLAVAAPVFGIEPSRVVALGVAVEHGFASARELALALHAAGHGISRNWHCVPPEVPRSITPESVRRTVALTQHATGPGVGDVACGRVEPSRAAEFSAH